MQPEKMFPNKDELKKHQNEGIIRPSKLEKGTILYVETVARIFEFHIQGQGRAIAKSNGYEPFLIDTPCTLVGCITENGTLFEDQIVHGLHLIMSLPKGRHVSGRVLTASLHGPGWSYELWTDLKR